MDILLDSETKGKGLLQRISEKVPELVFEVLCIVISILLALWIGDVAENFKNRKLAMKALINFRQELQANKDFMQQSLPLHTEYIKKLEAIQPPINSWSDIDRQIHFTGLGPSSAYNTAWDTAVATNALVQIDYDTVKSLSRVYLRQKYVESVRQKFLDVFYSPTTFRNDNAVGLVQSMHIMFLDLARVEDNVIKDYEGVLKLIDERYPNLNDYANAPLASSAPSAEPTLPAEAPAH
jgi:hypothetical protein